MDDSISRAAAIRALGNEPEVWTEYDDYALGRNNQWHYDVSVIKTVPAIQPRRGRWETVEGWDGDEDYRCSECGAIFTLIDGAPKDNKYFFCPSCGADMRGGENEQN